MTARSSRTEIRNRITKEGKYAIRMILTTYWCTGEGVNIQRHILQFLVLLIGHFSTYDSVLKMYMQEKSYTRYFILFFLLSSHWFFIFNVLVCLESSVTNVSFFLFCLSCFYFVIFSNNQILVLSKIWNLLLFGFLNFSLLSFTWCHFHFSAQSLLMQVSLQLTFSVTSATFSLHWLLYIVSILYMFLSYILFPS